MLALVGFTRFEAETPDIDGEYETERSLFDRECERNATPIGAIHHSFIEAFEIPAVGAFGSLDQQCRCYTSGRVGNPQPQLSPFLLRAIHCAYAHMLEVQRTDEFPDIAGNPLCYRCSDLPFAEDTCLSGNLPRLGVRRRYEPQQGHRRCDCSRKIPERAPASEMPIAPAPGQEMEPYRVRCRA